MTAQFSDPLFVGDDVGTSSVATSAFGFRNSEATAATSCSRGESFDSSAGFDPNGRGTAVTRATVATGVEDRARSSAEFSQRGPQRHNIIYHGKIQLEETVEKKESVVQRLGCRRCANVSRIIVDHKYVVFVSVLLTFFALLGDDLRLLCFDKAPYRVVDMTFNCLTIFCIAFFAMEVVLSCFGKVDYFFGFFFFLDTIATVTLAMDLTWVNEFILSGGGDSLELGDGARSARTARIGASVGRMVRVLRLIRIFKLYKAYLANKQRKKREAFKKDQAAMAKNGQFGATLSGGYDQSSKFHSEEDEWLQEEEEKALNEEQTDAKESLVGKKLSALTTRRVILLVLTMLLVLPSLRVLDPVTPMAPSYAADMIFEAFQEYEAGSGSREVYERAMLKAIYYHNWFTGQESCQNRGCPSDYFAHLFWVGSTGKNSTYVQSRVAKARLSQATVVAWDEAVGQQDGLYNYGKMPTEVLPLLSKEWTVECDVLKYKHVGISITQLKVRDTLDNPIVCPSDLRRNEWMRVSPRMLTNAEHKAFHLAFFFDLRPYVKLESLYGVFLTFFVCLVLCVSSILFANDANRLVLQPLEQMITKIEAIRDNPLIAIKMADQEFKTEEVNRMKKNKQKANSWWGRLRPDSLKNMPSNFSNSLSFKKTDASKAKPHDSEMYETVILEKTLVKLGWLLSLVFGEAGANIVSQNMSGNATAGVNAMVAGRRVDCIIGHARIRNFSTATEVLQGKVMTFVNQVAEIVHGIVDQFHGAANQNNGNTFLLIWKVSGLDKNKVAKLGDMSIMAFTNILAAVHRSPVLAAYRAHPGLQQRLGSNHKVSMSFGLHAGWAIEGAVGSEFKIDASYLSPNVTLAASLERATSQYGVSFLASQAVTKLCHKKMVNRCRLIDKVTLSGFTQPLELYTFDLDYNSVDVDPPVSRSFHWNVRQRFRARQVLETEKARKWKEDAFDQEDEEGGIPHMRRTYTFEFMCLFNKGYQNYSQGEWQVARRVLSQTYSMLGVKDGPSGALLNFMEASYQFVAPEGWNGVRALYLTSHEDT